MTILTITLATIGFLGFMLWLGIHLAFRPPVDDPPPASWISKQIDK